MTVPVESSVQIQKKRKPSLALTLSATGLLIAGGVGTYFLLTQGKALTRNLPPGANLIPQYALFTFSLTTDISQWQKLGEFGTPAAQKKLDKNLTIWRDRFLTNNGYDFQRDIQPWVGDRITFAILAPNGNVPPAKRVSTSGEQLQEQPLVIILPIKDMTKAQQIWSEKFNISVKPSPQTTQNMEIPIQTIKSPSGSKLSTVIINQKFLAIADNPLVIQQTINAYKSKSNLANSAGFAENFAHVSEFRPFAQFYINIPASAQIAAAAPNRRLPAQVLAQLQENQGLAGTISLKSTGIQLQGISWLNPNSQRQLAVENQGENMAKLLPPETLMMLSGSNLRQLWLDYVATSKNNPFAPIAPEQLKKSIKNYVNLDFDRDVLSWMTGGFSVSVVPNLPQEGKQEDFRAALLFMVKASDRRKAETFFTKLNETMKAQYQFQISQGNVAGKSVVNWIAPFGTLTATHGWLDEKTSFFVLGAPITNRIIPPSRNSLANSQVYKNTTDSGLNPSNGRLFLDIERGIQNFPLPNLFPYQNLILGSSHSLGVTSKVRDSRSQRYDIFLELKRSQEAKE
ncbi:FIG00870646: hypothetical protein [Richelia intracellularis]|nr:FIG00870646: hypothetical protein [Richelia intracellularis]